LPGTLDLSGNKKENGRKNSKRLLKNPAVYRVSFLAIKKFSR
jgi:hypothetical protein